MGAIANGAGHANVYGRGLDLAREHGHVDFDQDEEGWYVPEPEAHW
jgi:hypothetical protein